MTASGLTSRVEGSSIVAPTKTALPRRCIITNKPVDDEFYTVWDLPYVRGLLVLLVFGPWILLLAPAVVKRRCKLRAGLSREFRNRYARLKFFMLSLSLSPFGVIAAAVLLKSADVIFVFGIPSMLAMYFGVFAYVYYSSPLTVAKYEDGLFWIKGCSTEFLNSLESE